MVQVIYPIDDGFGKTPCISMTLDGNVHSHNRSQRYGIFHLELRAVQNITNKNNLLSSPYCSWGPKKESRPINPISSQPSMASTGRDVAL